MSLQTIEHVARSVHAIPFWPTASLRDSVLWDIPLRGADKLSQCMHCCSSSGACTQMADCPLKADCPKPQSASKSQHASFTAWGSTCLRCTGEAPLSSHAADDQAACQATAAALNYTSLH